jgi:hypothetical protein
MVPVQSDDQIKAGKPRIIAQFSALSRTLDACRAKHGQPPRFWRRGPESNRTNRICNPGHNRFATAPNLRFDKKGKRLLPFFAESGAGKESRTLDLNLGKVALYQLSYSRIVCSLTFYNACLQ